MISCIKLQLGTTIKAELRKTFYQETKSCITGHSNFEPVIFICMYTLTFSKRPVHTHFQSFFKIPTNNARKFTLCLKTGQVLIKATSKSGFQ